MVIDFLMDAQCGHIHPVYEDLLEYVGPRVSDDGTVVGPNFPWLYKEVLTRDNDRIRKALRKYIITENYNRRYFKVIRETDWTK